MVYCNVIRKTGWIFRAGIFKYRDTEIFRLRQCLSVFLSPEKEKRGKERAARGIPPCPPLCGGDTTTACGISGEDGVQVAQCGQVRVHLLNVLPRTNPARRGRAARLTEQTSLAPNTETFSAVHYISSAAATGRTRSPGGLGWRSRIEPRLLTSSLFAGINRGSLSGAVP